jgi:hypothetical protein
LYNGFERGLSASFGLVSQTNPSRGPCFCLFGSKSVCLQSRRINQHQLE